MTSSDTSYYLRRAEQEVEAAQRADHAAAVRSHYLLAGLYLDRVYGPDEPVRSGTSATAKA